VGSCTISRPPAKTHGPIASHTSLHIWDNSIINWKHFCSVWLVGPRLYCDCLRHKIRVLQISQLNRTERNCQAVTFDTGWSCRLKGTATSMRAFTLTYRGRNLFSRHIMGMWLVSNYRQGTAVVVEHSDRVILHEICCRSGNTACLWCATSSTYNSGRVHAV